MKRFLFFALVVSGLFAGSDLNAGDGRLINATYSVTGWLKSDADIVEKELAGFDFIYLMAPPAWQVEDFDLAQSEIDRKYVDEFAYSDESLIRTYISTVHKTGGKVLCSFPGTAFIDIASSEDRSRKFARMMAAFVEKYDYDGIELDWEHTIKEDLHLKFMQKIREELNILGKGKRQYWLTTALHPYRVYTPEQAEQLCACVDWINIMFYDMGGGRWGTVATHNCPLDRMKATIETTSWRYFPHVKLHIGLASYGFYYKGIRPGETVPDGKKLSDLGARYCNYTELPPLLEKGWTEQWDGIARCAYFFSPDRTEFMTLETRRSMDAKLDWVEEEGFGGVFWWEYSCDWIRPEKPGEKGVHLIMDYVTERVKGIERKLASSTGAVPASSPAVRYVGRTSVSENGSVSYDWSGTYFTTTLYGGRLDAEIACTGEAYFNVFADGQHVRVLHVQKGDTTLNIIDGLDRKAHEIMVQKRTEGAYGKVTVKRFILPSSGRIEASEDVPSRMIEFIGDSFTCGYGTEGKDRTDVFRISTENCDLTYAVKTARYFGADYSLIAHSGCGVVRNCDDLRRISSLTMEDRMLRTFDQDTMEWTPGYIPDLVVINLCTNDFSSEPHPYKSEFVEGYCRMIGNIREMYGPYVTVICYCPPGKVEPAEAYLKEVKSKLDDPRVHVVVPDRGLYNTTTDLGSAWHPNGRGQTKMAMSLIPYISTIMGWDVHPDKAYGIY